MKPVAPLVPKPRAREPTAIRLSTKNRATICVMAVNALAERRRRTFWKWQWGRLVAQEAFITQPLGSWARPGLSDNADRVPRLFEGSRQLRLRHHLREFLCHSLLRPRCSGFWEIRDRLQRAEAAFGLIVDGPVRPQAATRAARKRPFASSSWLLAEPSIRIAAKARR